MRTVGSVTIVRVYSRHGGASTIAVYAVTLFSVLEMQILIMIQVKYSALDVLPTLSKGPGLELKG